MNKLILIAILVLALFLRVWQIDSVPPGVFIDEASIGYDAYSIGQRGEDQYGKPFPIYFRSFATYQAPLYIYLTVLPVKVLGITPFSVRLISILSGVLLVLITYLLIKEFNLKKDRYTGLYAAAVVAISPWSIFFSRGAIEANLGILLFVTSLWFFFRGLNKKSILLILSSFVLLALTNYAYTAYRVLSLLTLVLLLTVFYRNFFNKKALVFSVILFCVIIIPQLFYTATEGSVRRYQQLEYTSAEYFAQNGGEYKELLFGNYYFIVQNFLARFFDYLSPKSLFLDSDPTLVRGIPDLAVFYPWFIIPALYGLFIISKKLDRKKIMFFLLLIFASILPSAITRETLYTLRVLPYLWIVGLIISFGLAGLIEKIKWSYLKVLILAFLLFFSLSIFYFHYFVLVKNERIMEHSGLMYKLFSYTTQHRNNQYIVDLTEPLDYEIAAFIYAPDLERFEKQANVNLNDYYNDLYMNFDFSFDNLVFRTILWEQDPFTETILVGDELTIPDHVAYQNGLEPVVTYKNTDLHSITIYKTHPRGKCLRLPKSPHPEVKCTEQLMKGN